MTDGPYAETKEQLGGYATFRFRDLEQAVKAWSNHPCLLNGDFLEIRPADEEFAARVEARLGKLKDHSLVRLSPGALSGG